MSIIPARVLTQFEELVASCRRADVCSSRNAVAWSKASVESLRAGREIAGASSSSATRGLLTRLAFVPVAADEHRRARIDVPGTDLDANRNAAQIPLAVFPPRLLVAVVDAHAESGFWRVRRRRCGIPLARGRRCERTIGTKTASIGAIFGGMRRPRSSPWVMIRAPSIRHDMPHDVVYACLML